MAADASIGAGQASGVAEIAAKGRNDLVGRTTGDNGRS